MEPTSRSPVPEPVGIRGMSGRIAVVRNPRSHRNRKTRDDAAHHPDILFAAPPSKDALAGELTRMAAAGIDLLIIDGGDGAVRDVPTRGIGVFGDAWPRLMVLPKGKTNALAVDLGMPGKLSLDEALARLPGAHTVRRSPLRIERTDVVAPPVMGFILGTGVFDTAIAAGQVAHRFGAFQGLAVAVTVGFGVVQALFGFGRTPWRAVSRTRILLGAERRELGDPADPVGQTRFAAGFSTLDGFPLGMKPFADEPGPIRCIAVDRPVRRVMALAPAILMGLDRPFLRGLGVHRGSAEQVALDVGARFIVDGEGYAPGRYDVRLGPQLEFLVP